MDHRISTKNIFFIWITTTSIILVASVCCKGMATFASSSEEISYSELKDMGADCDPLDNCKESRDNDQLDTYNCNCDNTCPEYDTCCLDSKHRVTGIRTALNPDIRCLPLYRSKIGVFMIEKCENGDPAIENLCKSNSEDVNDPFLMIPATSLATKITYKNYFCLVCNEDIDEDQIVLWNLRLETKSEGVNSSTMPNLRFDKDASFTGSWVVDGNGTSDVATVTIEIEKSVTSLVKVCKAGAKGLISNCSKEWTDDSIAQKCAAYMATVEFFTFGGWNWYRNPHCALCNYEDVKNRFCQQPKSPYVIRHKVKFDNDVFVGLFVLKDEETTCGRKMIYDKFAKKCRCNSQDSVMQDGKCVSKTT